MIFRFSRLAAFACGVVLLSVVPACGDDNKATEEPSTEAVRGPYLRENTCAAADSKAEGRDHAARLTQLSQTAGELLLVNGISPGPTIAVDGQLSSDQAADRASTVPGDASIAEALWVAAPRPETGLDPIRDTDAYYAAEARRISAFEVTEENLSHWLGPSWSSVVEVVEEFAHNGYEQYVLQVRDAPPMRSADAASERAELRAEAVDAGLESQWEAAQSIVSTYFWSCMMSSSEAGHDVDVSSSILGEILAADAVGAAFAETFGSPESVQPLATGLRMVLNPEPEVNDAGHLTKDFDPNEILSPEDVELMEAEEPSLEGP
ncbi:MULTISPECIES: hypothetical protein [unclassified Rhodococcus (in: high G+C Gram-positive bacteria)]|uniref:hypothetical protein n=1 Tax=unclassified Rhodococcus (in: high G+C Gram-positive bacteria) TaxID=192944 RepID=UPI001179E7E9|nr:MULTISPECIES: hypothetical protein [unclassified Rhodococcus (in: high G+C Gram-positive bacteria)]